MLLSVRRSSFSFALAGLVVVALACVALSPDATKASASDGTWTQLHSIPPAPPPQSPPPSGRRATGYAYDSLRNRLLIFGGYPFYNNDVSALDLATGAWHQILPSGAAPAPRYGATAIYDATNDRLIVFGGFNGGQLNDVWALPLSGSPVWASLTTAGSPPAARSFHTAIYDAPGQRMVMFGGFDGTNFLGDTWELSLGGSPTWSQIPVAHSADARDLAGAAFDPTRNQMLLFGGWNGAYLADTWSFSLSGTQDWSQIAAASPPPGRREISTAYDPAGDRLVIFGGNNGSLLQDTWTLQLSGAPAWQNESPVGPLPDARYGHASILDPVGNRFVIFGGLESSDHGNDTWGLSLGAPLTWSPILPPPPAPPLTPAPVRNYTAVLDPVAHEMLLFGGEISNHQLTNDLTAYSLGAPVVPTPIHPPGPPTARYAPRAVWDPLRDRMLVFGGYDGQFLNELWEYHPRPSTTWTQLFPDSAPPAPRFAGGMVQDAAGDRLLVFGGHSHDNDLNVDTEYNDLWELPLSGPHAMAWSQLTPTGSVPSGRWGFVMMPDPARQRVLVFGGGADVNHPTADVFALDLSTTPPGWSLLTPSGPAPSGRIIEAGVIEPLGDRLVIFGGFSGSTFLNDVWAMSLSGAPQWTQLLPGGPIPVGRDAITAIYDPTGSRMVVGCGFNPAISDYGGFLGDIFSLSWDAAVSAAASLIDSHAEPGLVRLDWFVTDAAGAVVTVQRKHGAEAWSTLGAPVASASDRVTFADRDVVAGEHYSYRLSLREGGNETLTDAVEIAVPTGFTLELVGASPNPSVSGRLTVALSLPRRMPGRLDLIDVAGRRVATRDLSGLAPGRQSVALGEGVSLAPGVYVIRLEAGGRAFAKKALVVQ